MKEIKIFFATCAILLLASSVSCAQGGAVLDAEGHTAEFIAAMDTALSAANGAESLELIASAVKKESVIHDAWVDARVASLLEIASPERAEQLKAAQAAWRKWMDLDAKFLACLATREKHPEISAGDLLEMLRRRVERRAFFMDEGAPGKWLYGPKHGADRPARDGEARDWRGSTMKHSKAVSEWNRSTVDLLEIIDAEAERQDKWLNELYKELRGMLTDAQKNALRDAQRAWLAMREADVEWRYDPDGGSLARIEANDDFLSKLIDCVAWLEDLVRQEALDRE